jgi:hypothetical protein
MESSYPWSLDWMRRKTPWIRGCLDLRGRWTPWIWGMSGYWASAGLLNQCVVPGSAPLGRWHRRSKTDELVQIVGPPFVPTVIIRRSTQCGGEWATGNCSLSGYKDRYLTKYARGLPSVVNLLVQDAGAAGLGSQKAFPLPTIASNLSLIYTCCMKSKQPWYTSGPDRPTGIYLHQNLTYPTQNFSATH